MKENNKDIAFKEKLKRKLIDIKCFLFKHKEGLIICSLLFFSLIALFPIGSLSNEAYIEDSAIYFADVAKKHTETKTYLPFIVEPKKETDTKMLDTEKEFYAKYGAFRETKATYVGTVNANKDHTIYLTDIDTTTNLSFMYVSRAGFSNVEYKEAWKHEYYPLQLMFKGIHVETGFFSFCYISQTHANKLLDKVHREHTKENYESLLAKGITLTMDGIKYNWLIADIYLETNYFYDAVHEVLGDFLLGYNKYPDGFKKQSLYFMRDYAYQNKYYMEYAKSIYGIDKYDYSIGTNNIVDGFIVNQNMITQIFNNQLNPLAVVLGILIAIAFIFAGYFVIKFKYMLSFKHLIFIVPSLIFPYLLYKVIYLISHNVYFFSGFSSIINLLLIVSFLLFFIILYIVYRYYPKLKMMRKEE